MYLGWLSELVVRLVIVGIVAFRLATVGCQDHEVQVSLVLDLCVFGKLCRFLSDRVLASHVLMVISIVECLVVLRGKRVVHVCANACRGLIPIIPLLGSEAIV